ncbi:RNA pyrophosphohydrolase [Acidithiobacillus sp. HP-11]|uniref:RNA pyrophosphohydrolase n=1 Tax=Acidithiobacillus sp. HP-11 TaxID=2697656 RepID=UPI00187A50F0|nr:RNA pyrophosphohydrolase [Acidithiobacillus sp. HP-11]MBE7565773.1 RNA pyrophosphohydrolase [Acidithiobacillus sp. HP-11]
MIDADGYRPNVGMIICNEHNQVLWAKRRGENAWQFPQGGIDHAETPEQAMFRELEEEVGTAKVCIIGRTQGWLRYEVPCSRHRAQRRRYRGQKQIWFLLRFEGDEAEINTLTTQHPEFETWRWVDYWMPAREIIAFKRRVYWQALQELAPLINVGPPPADAAESKRKVSPSAG